jgi:putative PIN family toxin of toxin-antitoxin system
MIHAILDTNVLVQAVISSPPAASARVLDAYYEGRFRIVFSPATLDELIEVLLVPHIRRRHGMSDDELLEFVGSLLVNSDRYTECPDVSPALARDATDVKFLGLSERSGAEFLVTNDRRHLLGLRRHGRTEFVTPAEFLRRLR